MKILLLKAGALGDILMTTPVIRQLREHFPSAQIDYMVGNGCQTVLNDNPHLNSVITFDSNIFFKHKLIDMLKLAKNIRAKQYDIVFLFDKHWIFSLTSFLAGIKKRIGFARDFPSRIFLTEYVNYKLPRHEIHYYLDLVDKIAKANHNDTKMDLSINKTSKEKVQTFIRKNNLHNFLVFINSGGENSVETGGTRKLPNTFFKKTLKKLSKNNQILLIGGKTDKDYYDKFILNKNITNIAGQFTNAESTELMRFAKRVYTTDCGPMHMAATVNNNITAYFGPTNPKRKAPLVKHIETVWNDEDIYEETYELYGKIPKKTKTFFRKLK